MPAFSYEEGARAHHSIGVAPMNPGGWIRVAVSQPGWWSNQSGRVVIL